MLATREKYLALIVILVMVAFMADRLILTPVLKSWRQDGTRLAELRGELVVANALADSVPGWRRESERRRELAYPSGRGEAEDQLLKLVAARAVARRIQLKGIRPSWREHGSTGKDSPSQLELSVSASGSVGAVAGLLYDLETMEGPVRVDRVRVHSRGESGRVLDLDLMLAALPGDVLAEKKK